MTIASSIDALTFPLSGTRLIEASAGTGKTYTIAALYVRLILGHNLSGTELLPPDILVVTFTDAATQELRERIRARLTQAAGYFRAKAVDSDDFLQRLRADYAEELWSACAYRLELAANWMDEAAVYTIHGWCNRMLQQHAFDSGSLFKQDVDTDDQELLNQVVRDYWRQFFYPLSATACQAVYQLASTPDALAQCLKPLLFETEALGLDCAVDDIAHTFKAWEDWESQRQDLETQARALWLQHQPALEVLLNDASQNDWLNGTQYKKADFVKKLQQINAWAAGDALTLETLNKFSQQKLQKGLKKAYQANSPVFEHTAFHAIDNLVEHCAAEIDIADSITRHAIHWIRTRYDSEKLRIARMTFHDMLTRLDAALKSQNGDKLADVIRQQYPIALIDEFQDTDPVQYRIFSRLYPADVETNLGCFMIGDPKQAIYSFRGGDIFTYLKAHQATQGRHYTLDTNFRSTQALVAGVNQIFSHADQQQTEGAFCFKQENHNPLPFIPVAAQGREDVWVVDQQPAAALTLWTLASDATVGMPEYRQQMAEATASEIVHLLHSADLNQTGFQSKTGGIRPLQPADIAILVRSSHEANVMRNALSSRQLRSVYLSERESIYATPEASDVLIWLKALAQPRNERKVRAALSTATLGWSYQSLQQLTLNESAWEQELERFLAYQQRWLKHGILPTLRQLMSDYELPARLMRNPDGERRLTNLLHLAELLQQASSHLEGEPALIRHLAETMAAADQAAEDSVIRLESDANLIKIITIHKSKGLEYPLVFLPFICSFREVGGRNNRYYRYHDDDLNLRIDLHKNDDIKAISDKERLQEDLRLLYVAITRARYACWLGIAAIKVGNSKSCQLEKSALGYLLGWQTGMASSELMNLLAQLKGHCPAIAINDLPEANITPYQPTQTPLALERACVSTTTINDHWWIASYSALQSETASISSQASQPDEIENYRDDKRNDENDPNTGLQAIPASGIHGLPRGAGPGVLIHECLEYCAQSDFKAVHAHPTLGRQLIEKVFNQSQWLDNHDILEQGLRQWLNVPLLPDTSLSLSDLETAHYQAEMEFLLGADSVDVIAVDELVHRHSFPGQARPRLMPNQINGLLKGFIDLVFVYNDQYYVLDYKFNALGNSDADYTQPVLDNAMLTKRYDLQAVLYLLALHRLLKTRLGDDYTYENHIGGYVYLFLRGAQSSTAGRVFAKPPKILIESLDALFSNAALQGEHA